MMNANFRTVANDASAVDFTTFLIPNLNHLNTLPFCDLLPCTMLTAYSRMSAACRFLRPYLQRSVRRTVKPDHARAYIAFQRRFASKDSSKAVPAYTTNDFAKRSKQLEEAGDLNRYYPLNPSFSNTRTARQIREEFQALANDEIRRDVTVTVFGMFYGSCKNTMVIFHSPADL
ncbi:hypothetical protein IWZ03DRAFT_138844 [Phyllosticta citriasiana]|uniref:Uncharacterized protein n=1 Tax=Phyllosticta citriasiana TaxID=595635 RepID=A0ABR1KSF5_9PEZI